MIEGEGKGKMNLEDRGTVALQCLTYDGTLSHFGRHLKSQTNATNVTLNFEDRATVALLGLIYDNRHCTVIMSVMWQ